MSKHSIGYAWLALSMMLVGAYVALSKHLLPDFPPQALAFVRFSIAAVFMAPWLLEWRGKWRQVGLRDAAVLFGMSFFGNFLFTMCMLLGVKNTSVAAAGIIMSLLPATIALLSGLILRERLTVAIGGSVLLAVLGVAALSVFQTTAGQTALGNLLMVGALLCEALYVIGGKYLSAGYSPKQVAVSMNSTGWLLTLPLGLPQTLALDWATISPATWALMVFYAVSASQIAPWLWFRGVKSVPASRAGVMTVALPLTAAALGLILFNETWTVWHTFAFGCALTGVLWVTRASKEV
ncbi:MAG: DMT family transporter [Formosimonas sp.]